MARGVEVRVEGLLELRRKLRELPAGMDKRAVSDALRAGARVVRSEAMLRAPVAARPHKFGNRRDRLVLPGNLRRSIRIAALRDTPHFATVAVGVGRGAFYWRFVEFGTRFIRPRSFLRLAFEVVKDRALDKIVERLRERIEAISGARLK